MHYIWKEYDFLYNGYIFLSCNYSNLQKTFWFCTNTGFRLNFDRHIFMDVHRTKVGFSKLKYSSNNRTSLDFRLSSDCF
ncbi:hypothetical protein X975_05454, partial [Stegodyphus mimosarum]